MEFYQSPSGSSATKFSAFTSKTTAAAHTCRYIDIGRQTFYRWKPDYDLESRHVELRGL